LLLQLICIELLQKTNQVCNLLFFCESNVFYYDIEYFPVTTEWQNWTVVFVVPTMAAEKVGVAIRYITGRYYFAKMPFPSARQVCYDDLHHVESMNNHARSDWKFHS